MNNFKNTILVFGILALIIVVSAFANTESQCRNETANTVRKHPLNMFVTHGHCSLPFAGDVENLRLDLPERKDGGNPIENMKLSFEVNPKSFNVCSGDDLTQKVQTPGLFVSEKNENMKFASKDIYTMGIDWYQVNGTLSIKGEAHPVKFFISGIRESNAQMASTLILSGRMDLLDWGIDYDKIVNGESNNHPTKWMYLNMRIDVNGWNS